MRKSDVHEVLATLYLRLNGYFTTGLILHSNEWGQARTEIDCLAIRHPHHLQPERCVETAEFLRTRQAEIDLILCEVKSSPDDLRFNDPIRTDVEAICAALRWSGLLEEEQVRSVAERLQPLLQGGVPAEVSRRGIVEGACRVRPLLCCPPCHESDPNRWCLTGSEIFRFVRQCFNPPTPRDSCSTRYNFQQWGYPFTPIVRVFKNEQGARPVALEDLYKCLEAE